MKYRHKLNPKDVVEAIGFEELVQIALATEGTNIVNGVPWAFTYAGVPWTHETDDHYLFAGARDFRRGQYFVLGYPLSEAVYDSEAFHTRFEQVTETLDPKAGLVTVAKQFRKDLNESLQKMKGHRDALAGASLEGVADDPREVVPNLVLSIRHVEDAIMRLGMQLKAIGNPNPYPTSYDPSSTKVEPTADGLKL